MEDLMAIARRSAFSRLPLAHPWVRAHYHHLTLVEGAVASLVACGIVRRVAAQLVRETIYHEIDRASRTIHPPDFGRRLSELQRRVAVGATRKGALTPSSYVR